MLFHQKPQNFPTQMYVSAGILEYKGKILLLKRTKDSSSPEKWCEPGWKREDWESSQATLIREIAEEIGIDICNEVPQFLFTKYFYFLEKYIEIDFYKIIFQDKPEILLNLKEHSEYIWIEVDTALSLDLVEDFEVILREIYQKASYN